MPLPPGVRVLKWLVIVLTLTMIVGVITVVAVLVTRIPQVFGGAGGRLPETIALPEGASARAVTFGNGWVGVVVAGADGGERFLVYSTEGDLRQEIALTAQQ